jgi:hypothetical protein
MRILEPLRNEHGIGLVGMAMSMTLFCGITAVAIDLGRIALVANEAQTAADVAATAAAKAWVKNDPAHTYTADANALLALNKMNGVAVPSASTNLTLGVITTTGTFTTTIPPGGSADAVRAITNVTVNNLFTGVIGFPTTPITRTAIAAFEGTGGGTPGIPLALGDCDFGVGHDCTEGNCPTITQIPNGTNNGAWINPSNGNASSNAIGAFFASPCGSGTAMPMLTLDSTVNATNGQDTPLENKLFCMVCTLNIKEFLVPVISCSGNFTGAKKVVGFATIVIDSFTTATGSTRTCGGSGGGALKSVNVHSVRRTDPQDAGTPGGCTTCGTGTVRLAG